MRELIMFGPCDSWSFNDVFGNFAEQSNQTSVFSGFFRMKNGVMWKEPGNLAFDVLLWSAPSVSQGQEVVHEICVLLQQIRVLEQPSL